MIMHTNRCPSYIFPCNYTPLHIAGCFSGTVESYMEIKRDDFDKWVLPSEAGQYIPAFAAI